MASPAVIGALRVVLGADTAALDKGLRDAQRGLAKFGEGAKGVADAMFNLRNAMIVTAAAGVVAFTKKATDFGDQIAKTSQKIGITTDSLQGLRYAAGLSGTTTEDLDAALLQLNKRIGDVNGGVTEAAVVLGKLGFSMAQIRGQKTDELFSQIADRIRGIADPMERAKISTELFGKAGQQLLPTLMMGSAGLSQMATEARKLGLVLSKETLDKAEAANDEFTRIATAMRVAGVSISVGLLPALEKVRENVTSASFQNGVKNLGIEFGKLISWMVDHRAEVEAFAAAFAGSRLLAPFGPAAAAVGALVGGLTAYTVAGGNAVSVSAALDKQIQTLTARIESWRAVAEGLTVNPSGQEPNQMLVTLQRQLDKAIETRQELARELTRAWPAMPELPAAQAITITPFNPEIAKAVEDLSLKVRTLRGDYANLAPGFIEAAAGLKVFKDGVIPTSMSLESMSPQMLQMNAQMLILAGFTLTKPQNEFIKLAEAIAAVSATLERGGLSAEKYAELQGAAASLSGKLWEMSATSLGNSFESIGTSMSQLSDNWARMAKVGQAIGATIAFVNAYVAASEAFAKTPFPANIAIAAGVLASGLKMVAAIKSAATPAKFATGGSFQIGGSGGVDSQLVPIMATPNERVHVEQNKYGESSDGGTKTVNITMPDYVSRDAARAMLKTIEGLVGDGLRVNLSPA